MMTKRWTNKRSSLATGAKVEEQAALWLKQQGLGLVISNYRCRLGEIDLVMRDHSQLVFVEVRFRSHKSYGDGLESVTWRKQQKLLKAASHFLMENPRYADEPCRFDVLGVKPAQDNNNTLQWNWIKNAFCK